MEYGPGPTKSIFDIFILKQVISEKFHKLQFLNTHKS